MHIEVGFSNHISIHNHIHHISNRRGASLEKENTSALVNSID